jgi:ABC-2 type transport system ATP-binding protein
MEYAIETNHLSKSYGNVHAVDSIHLRVKPGEIYGFLGLNGAGKTTTIRLLLGMIRPQTGSIKVLGQSVGPHGSGPWRHIGHLVEHPSAYPELTVRENLEISRRLYGISDRKASGRVLESLGLDAYADRKAGTLSTGNFQRLGLARALLHEPELLLLDEPANGLDPAGVVEIRQLLSHLAQEQGVTVFMSSHILPEVDRLATRIGIIHKGRLIEELDAAQMESMRVQHLEIRTHHLTAAQMALEQAGFTVKIKDDSIFLSEARALQSPDEIATLLVKAGAAPIRLAVEQEDLEQYFLRLTGEKP